MNLFTLFLFGTTTASAGVTAVDDVVAVYDALNDELITLEKALDSFGYDSTDRSMIALAQDSAAEIDGLAAELAVESESWLLKNGETTKSLAAGIDAVDYAERILKYSASMSTILDGFGEIDKAERSGALDIAAVQLEGMREHAAQFGLIEPVIHR